MSKLWKTIHNVFSVYYYSSKSLSGCVLKKGNSKEITTQFFHQVRAKTAENL